jgi:hypothetical protein
MGSITRSLANNITTSGVILPAGITNSSVSAVTSFANASGGTLILLSTQTASNSANISFTSGIDSTYDEYQFKFIDVHPRTDNVGFGFQGSTNGGSTYATTITSSAWQSIHRETVTGSFDDFFQYATGGDLAQSTSYQPLNEQGWGNGADEDGSGVLTIFNPSSTTYVKHFISSVTNYTYHDYSIIQHVGGYFNTTSAVNAFDFKMTSGNFDGTIKLYGVKKS